LPNQCNRGAAPASGQQQEIALHLTYAKAGLFFWCDDHAHATNFDNNWLVEVLLSQLARLASLQLVDCHG
jgi:hypothetical protein